VTPSLRRRVSKPPLLGCGDDHGPANTTELPFRLGRRFWGLRVEPPFGCSPPLAVCFGNCLSTSSAHLPAFALWEGFRRGGALCGTIGQQGPEFADLCVNVRFFSSNPRMEAVVISGVSLRVISHKRTSVDHPGWNALQRQYFRSWILWQRGNCTSRRPTKTTPEGKSTTGSTTCRIRGWRLGVY
jgi:hypothetical protein